MKRHIHLLIAGSLFVGSAAAADASSQIDAYSQQGAGAYSAAAGELFWNQAFSSANGEERSCSNCHGKDPSLPGKHHKTGKAIKPMAVRVNSKRFTDPKHTEKWFLRNCRWTLGRPCTAQEKGDVITWLNQY